MNIICYSLPNLGNGAFKQVDVSCPVVHNPRSLKTPEFRSVLFPTDLNSGVFSFAKVENSGAKFNLLVRFQILREGVTEQAYRRTGKFIRRRKE